MYPPVKLTLMAGWIDDRMRLNNNVEAFSVQSSQLAVEINCRSIDVILVCLVRFVSSNM